MVTLIPIALEIHGCDLTNRVCCDEGCTQAGSAIQVMLPTQFRATVGQKQTRKQGDQQQPCSSERRAQHVDQAGTRTMAIPAMVGRIIRVKRANASLVPRPKIASCRVSGAPWWNTCCMSASRGVGSAVRWASVSPGSCIVWWRALPPVPMIDMSGSHLVQRTWCCDGWKPKPMRCGAL
jgi:hypothetical protein